MKKYQFSFKGRQSGAIGIFYKISDTYEANNIHEALSLLYEDYEHIQGLTIKEGSKYVEVPEKINWVSVRSYREREKSRF
jgi:hypothetical protein